jgi:hypothetical protein
MALGATDPRTLAATVARLWRPPSVSDAVLLAFYRAWLVSFPVGLVSGLAGLAAFGAAIARQPFIGGRGIVVLVVVGLVPVILRHSLPLLAAARLGYVTRRGVPIRPAEEPRRFWFWVAATAVLTVIEIAVAAYLLSVAIGPS